MGLSLVIWVEEELRINVTVRKGRRTVARAKPRTVPASRRAVRVQLNRRLPPGRYSVRVTVEAGGVRVTRSRALTFAASSDK